MDLLQLRRRTFVLTEINLDMVFEFEFLKQPDNTLAARLIKPSVSVNV